MTGKRTIAIITRWGSACGMDEYARAFVRHVATPSFDVVVHANHEEVLLNDASDVRVVRDWSARTGDVAQLVDGMRAHRPGLVCVQFNWGYIPEDVLLAVSAECSSLGIPLVIELHATLSAGPERLETIAPALHAASALFVHGQHDVDRLGSLGLADKTWLYPLPHEQVPVRHQHEALQALNISDRRPVIATFGFLQPRKNTPELIRAIDTIRTVYPGVLLLGCTAIHPRGIEADTLLECVREIRTRGLVRHVQLMLDFLPESWVLSVLHAADLIVLPYSGSAEGSSAAATLALSAQRPLVVSDAPLFDSLGPAGYRLPGTDADSIAEACLHLLDDEQRREALQHDAQLLAERTTWQHVAPSVIERLEVARNES